jgi:TM2 domain-containing membrane protein YozV
MQGIAEKIKDYHKPYSPALAGIYSALVPGLGQVYLGRYSEALSAFSLTGVFAGLSIYNVYLEKNYKPRADRNYWAASFFGALAGIFYFSNIYNAVNMAQQMNRFYQHQMMDRYSKKIYRYQLEIPVLTF